MAAPVFVSVVLDKPAYKSGDKVTLTVTYQPATDELIPFTVTLTGEHTAQTAQEQGAFTDESAGTTVDPTDVTADSGMAVSWIEVSNSPASDGSGNYVAVFTTTAP